MKQQLIVSLEAAEQLGEVPNHDEISNWAHAAYMATELGSAEAEIGVRLIGKVESQSLNAQYRHKNSPTNVLSFPLNAPLENGGVWLGDLAICAPVVQEEAKAQNKSEKAHWAHMVVHGLLHLQGYDHEEDQQALIMEDLEQKVMLALGFNNPYEESI